MKHVLKFTVIFLCIFVLALVVTKKYIGNDHWCYAISALLGLAVSFGSRKYVIAKSFSYLFFTSLFLLIIFLPFIGPKESVSLEKRKLASFPEFHTSNVWRFFKQYNDYFSDRFAFRNEGLQLIALIKMRVFAVSSVPDKVSIGDDNWLFSSGYYFWGITCDSFPPQVLRLMEANLEITTHWMADHRIQYYFTCLPVKARVYGEKLPEDQQKIMAFSRLRQVYDYVKNNKKIRFIEVTDKLIEGRKVQETFLKTDTHWNQFGAYLGYEEIMEAIRKDFPDLYTIPLDSFHVRIENSDGGDLMMNLGLKSGVPYDQPVYKLKSQNVPQPVDSSFAVKMSKKIFIRQMNPPHNKKKIFIVHDSMTMNLLGFLSPSFERVFYDWHTGVNVPLVMIEKPDILLHEMSEVFIAKLVELPLEIEADSAFIKTNYPDYYKIKEEAAINPEIFY